MGVTLYTSRVVLDVLGVDDYGIYNVVGGVVAMASVITGSLGASCSRFITFAQGKDDLEHQIKVFSTSVNILIILALLILIVGETIGIWFLNTEMNIPEERLNAAFWVLQFSIFTFVVNLLSVPYNAAIIAHEDMKVFATASIFDVLLKLAAALSLFAIINYDKLIIYALLMFLAGVIMRVYYGVYCKRHYKECVYKLVNDRSLLREMLDFAGWSFVGCSAQTFITQGVNIIVNLFFGVAANAARGVAVQVEHALRQFVNSFMTALDPRITKSFAQGETDYVLKLVYYGAKYAYFLAFFFALPLIVEAEFVLGIWLKDVPEFTVLFVRWTALVVLAEVLSLTMLRANAASGKIRKYQLVVGGVNMTIFPISWLCFHLGMSAVASYIVHFIIYFINIFVRIRMMHGILPITYKDFISKVFAKVIPVSLLAATPMLFLSMYMEDSWIRFGIVGCTTVMVLPLAIYWLGLSEHERLYAISTVKKFYNDRIKRVVGTSK